MRFDLSDDTGAPLKNPTSVEGPPTGRASDVFRTGASAPIKGGKAAPQDASLVFDRRETSFDPFVSSIFYISLVISLLGLAYLLWGIWSGSLALPNFVKNYSRADRIRIGENLQMVQHVVEWTLAVDVILFLFLNYADSMAGYGLIIVGLFFNVGIPSLSSWFLQMEKSTPFKYTTVPVIAFIREIAWIPMAPGALLVIFDILRRIVVSLEGARLQKSKLRYGQGQTASHAKGRNVFLGRCWNMPYCREPLRERCPVHTKRTFPCWRYKQGCMCEQSIAILGSSPDWKKSVAIAMAQLEGKPAPVDNTPGNPMLQLAANKGRLTWAEKKQRCRECAIYNTHQEQKYKLAVGMVFALVGFVLFQFNAQLINGIDYIFANLNRYAGHLSLASNNGAELLATGVSDPVAWFILIFLSVFVISKLLQLAEYCCFTIKI